MVDLSKMKNIETTELVADAENNIIDVLDPPTLESGIHKGRIKEFTSFVSKNTSTKYGKITIGTKTNFANNGYEVIEVDRVWLADYRSGSRLIKQLEKLGVVEDKKFYPDRLIDLPVQFVIKPNERATDDSDYKVCVTDIEKIDSLPDNLNFHYKRIGTWYGYKLVPDIDDLNADGKSDQKNSSKSKIAEVIDDDDPLSFLDKDDDEAI